MIITTKKRNILINKLKSKSFFYLLSVILLSSSFLINCSNQDNESLKDNKSVSSSKNIIKTNVLVTSTGYGDSKESALQDAKNECAFKAFGKIKSDKNGKLIIKNNGKCINYSLISESKDEIGMWSIKIEAEVTEKI